MKAVVISALGVMTLLAVIGAGAWLLAAREASPVSAEQVMQQTCEQMAGLDSYDTISTIKTTVDGTQENYTITLKASVSGKDYQMSVSSDDSAVVDETRRVNGVGYYRSTSGSNEWQVSKGVYRDFDEYLSDLGATPLCPNIAGVTRKGEEELNGEKVTVYTSGDDITVLDDLGKSFRGQKEASTHEYWVNSQGVLVQHRQNLYEVVRDDEGGETAHYLILTRFMDVGEANTITAPTLP